MSSGLNELVDSTDDQNEETPNEGIQSELNSNNDWNGFIQQNEGILSGRNLSKQLQINPGKLKQLLLDSLRRDSGVECPLNVENLYNLHRKFREEIKDKNSQVQKMTDQYMPVIAGPTSRKSSSVPRGSRKSSFQGRLSSANKDMINVNNFNELLNNHDEKTIEKLQSEIHKIEQRLRIVEDVDNLKKVEALIKAKEIECNILERKVRALKMFVKKKDSESENDVLLTKKNYIKQISHLQKEIKHFEDLHKELQVKISKKDLTLRKHSEIISKLFEKYKHLCDQLSVEKKITVKQNEAGFVDVILPPETKLSKKITQKQREAERTIDKIERINTFQRRFTERVEKKELPNFLKWRERQSKFHRQIKRKIEKCEDLYYKYKESKYSTPIDSLVFKKFEDLRDKYNKEFVIDTTYMAKILELIKTF